MSSFARNLACVIGVNTYRNGISSLQNAVNDAKRLIEILRDQHGYYVWDCLDESASLDNIHELLSKTLLQEIKSNDRLLFYFAGHGIALNGDDGPEGYLIPQDGVLGDTKTYLPMRQLQEYITLLPCRHFLGILDCCFAGAFRWSSTRDLSATPSVIHKERYDRFVTDYAWQVITSAASDQKALDSLVLNSERGQIGNHSPFASALFDALEGAADVYPRSTNNKQSGDGVITATELYLYLRDRVETGTEGLNQRQTPAIWTLSKHDKGEYIFLTPGHELNLPPAPPLDESKNPYRGLQAFNEENASLFFGRSALVDKLHEAVKNNRLTTVLGASGSGKSSLVKAGLIPKLRKCTQDNWLILAPIRPGEAPIKALNDALEAVKIRPVQQQQKSLADSIGIWARSNPDSKLLLFIDQSEELITLCKDEEEREAFLKLIANALITYPTKLRVLLTLRSDFEPQLREAGLKYIPTALNFGNTVFKNNWQTGRFIVPAMSRAELREAIEKPIETRVMYFDPHNLVDDLIDEVAGMPGALPLLSFALSELYLKYLRRQREAEIYGDTIERSITLEDYKEIGGVIQSLTARADLEYNALVEKDSNYEHIIKHVMLRMVALGGELARRKVPLSELEYPKNIQELVNNFIKEFCEAILLVSGTDTEGISFIEPAHDALVRGWQKLRTWLQQEKSLGLQRRLTPAALEWKSNQHTKFLWYNDPYLDVLEVVLQSKNKNWLNQVEIEFVQRSINQRQRKTRLRQFAIGGAFLFVFGVAEIQRIQTQNAEIQNLALSSQTLFSSNRQLDALINGIKAGTALKNAFWIGWFGIGNDTQAQVLNALQQTVYWMKESNRLEEHQSPVYSVRFSPNNRIIASAGNDRSIILWNRKGQIIAKRLVGHKEKVNSIDFSRNGNILASASSDGTIKLWNLKDVEESNTTKSKKITSFQTLTGKYGHTKKVNSVSFNANGEILASGSSDGNIKLWKTSNGKLIKTFPRLPKNAEIQTINFNKDGTVIASGSNDGIVRLWNLNGQVVKSFANHNNEVVDVDFSHDGKLLASAGFDNKVNIWEWKVDSDKPIKTLSSRDNQIYNVKFSPDDKTLAFGGSNNFIKLFNIEYLDDVLETDTLKGHSKDIYSIHFSPDGKTIASASADGNVRLWNLKPSQMIYANPTKKTISLKGKITPGQEFTVLEAHQDKINSLTFISQDKILASASSDKNIILWHLNPGTSMTILTGHQRSVGNIKLSPNNIMLASASADGTVKIWNLAERKEMARLPKFNKDIYSINFHPDSNIITSADSGASVRLWSLDNCQKTQYKDKCQVTERILPKKIRGYSSIFSLDGKLLITANNQSIGLWRVSDGENIGKLKDEQVSIYAIKISPDGQTFASAGTDKTVKLWNIREQKLIATFKGHTDEVRDVSFHPNGKMLASASADNTIKVWDIKNQREIVTFKGHSAPVFSIDFSTDGQYLATAGKDKKIMLWNLNFLQPNNLLMRACQLANDYLQNNQEKKEYSNLCK
jgi:WD40 repeat protein/energy-coupling factor transporter ATP-binding protein EcfA2